MRASAGTESSSQVINDSNTGPPSEYSVLEAMATSSRSVVYRGKRMSDGATVVLKSFNQGESTSQQRRELELELQTLRQLSSPGVLRGYEVCDVGGLPTLVLEHFGGEALKTPPQGWALEDCLRIGIQAARALGHIHERGIVHNDVKPSNLLLNPSTQELKFIDFHLASGRASASASEPETRQLEGSLPYLSPERTGRMNRQPDYRADYYSLGVTLFQLAAGQLPFHAADPLGWAHAHLSKQAPLLSELKPAIPRAFAELVAKLMAKNPDERYQSSRGLLADLETCANAWSTDRRIPQFSLGSRDVSPRFEVSRELVGRDADAEALQAVFDQVRASHTHLLLLSGAPGVGKSSILGKLARSASDAGAFFLTSTCDQRHENVPYSALVHSLQSLIAQLLTQSDTRLLDWKQRLITGLGSNVAVMCDLVPALAQIVGAHPAAIELSPSETQHRLEHVLQEFVKVFARKEHPLVIAIDDSHSMDASTAEALSALLTSSEVHHVMVVAVFRDGEVGPSQAVSRLREKVGQTPGIVRELEMKPLDEPAVAHLVAASLHVSVAEATELAALIHEKTAGNPFFIGELLASLHRQGILQLDWEQGRWRYDIERARACQASDNVGALMAERIERMSPPARELLAAASCFGTSFELPALCSVLELEPEAAEPLLWEAATERLVLPTAEPVEERSTSRVAGYLFQHARVRQAAYARLTDAERVRIHRRIGERLRTEASGDTSQDRVFDILHHLNLGRSLLTEPRERLDLAELNLKATQRALRTAAFADRRKPCRDRHRAGGDCRACPRSGARVQSLVCTRRGDVSSGRSGSR